MRKLFRNNYERIIAALDTSDPQKALSISEKLSGSVGMVKVGLELFVSEGPGIVRTIRDNGMPVFLDLKLHDIPNTVYRASRQAGRLGVSMITVHASGGSDMISAAVKGALEGSVEAGFKAPCILAVTVLTSIDTEDYKEIGWSGMPSDGVERLALLALKAGAGGIVCSPREASFVRRHSDCLIVTPGIRPAGNEKDDQARISTPAEAIEAGADYIVVGRPIYLQEDPKSAARTIAADINRAG